MQQWPTKFLIELKIASGIASGIKAAVLNGIRKIIFLR